MASVTVELLQVVSHEKVRMGMACTLILTVVSKCRYGKLLIEWAWAHPNDIMPSVPFVFADISGPRVRMYGRMAQRQHTHFLSTFYYFINIGPRWVAFTLPTQHTKKRWAFCQKPFPEMESSIVYCGSCSNSRNNQQGSYLFNDIVKGVGVFWQC